MVAAGAAVAVLPVAVHDGLQDGGERRHSDPGADQDRVLGAEDVARRGAVRTVQVDLKRRVVVGRSEAREGMAVYLGRTVKRESCTMFGWL